METRTQYCYPCHQQSPTNNKKKKIYTKGHNFIQWPLRDMVLGTAQCFIKGTCFIKLYLDFNKNVNCKNIQNGH